jgi:hypothetical protein
MELTTCSSNFRAILYGLFYQQAPFFTYFLTRIIVILNQDGLRNLVSCAMIRWIGLRLDLLVALPVLCGASHVAVRKTLPELLL